MGFLPLILLLLIPVKLQAQQVYVDNKQLDCKQNWTATLGFLCNGAASCTSYLTFRSTTVYNNPVTIAYLLSADASLIAAANNISDVDLLPVDTIVIVPVNCSCFHSYYQHNASYTLKRQGETYLSVANETYQALTTCQALEAQNPYNFLQLFPEMRLVAPLRCACPTPKQAAAGYKYLLTYLVRQENTYNSIAGNFAGAGADVQGILDANTLTQNDVIFFFTPLLVPLKTEPTKEDINTVASPPPPLPTPALPTTLIGGGSSSNKWVFIGVGIGAAILVILCILLLVWFIRHRRSPFVLPPPPPPNLADKSVDTATRAPSSWSMSLERIRGEIETLTVYKCEEIEKATNSFAESNRINGSPYVYFASFKGDNAVVKMMKGDVWGEIDVLRQIKHSRIIRLSGYCLHQGITYLVYEYAEKGSLAEWLHGVEKYNCREVLSWKQRVQIAYDVADALNYLHNFTNPPYIHKNLTSSNVLLDGTLRAKIANFGLARTVGDDWSAVTRHVVGTYGYMAPEYIESGLVTPKLDVFALGVVMLELLSGKEAVKDEVLLYESVEGNVREKLREFMDPEYPLEVGYAMGELARRCVARYLDERPHVSEVFVALSKLLSSSLDWNPENELMLPNLEGLLGL